MSIIKKIAASLFALCLALSFVPALALGETDIPEENDILITETEAPELPSWYPEDISSWTWTPAPAGASRVIDEADLFTDNEEALLKANIAEKTAKFAADIVVVTVPTTGSFSHMEYADDYYDYNGFGVGEEHDGFLLLICMDPSHRGGWCTVTGTRPRQLYTEVNANALDDVLYEYLGSRMYYDGVCDWVNNIGTLLDKGIPFAPDWFPSSAEQYVRKHDPNAPRIADDANLLTSEELEKLEAKRSAISEKYGVDIVINTANDTYSLGKQSYMDSFYKYKGYGYGEGYDGIMLSLFAYEGAYTNVYGDPSEKLTSRNVELLDEAVGVRAELGEAYSSIDRWLSYLDTTLRTGHTPRKPAVWAGRSAIAGIISLITSSISVASAKSSMKTVRTAYEANDHLVPGTLAVERLADQFTHTTVARVYSPIERGSSGGGSSGGHSSYSGGHSSSSGTSHSGSGRSF